MQAFLKHSSYTSSLDSCSVRTTSKNEIFSLPLTAKQVTDLLQDDCAKAMSELIPVGLEQLRVLDHGILLIFHSKPALSRTVPTVLVPGDEKSPTSPQSPSLLDKTLDILARSATMRSQRHSCKPGFTSLLGRVF